ncbi:MAG: hypothetical protein EBY17_30270, partial [Acidobacteriia bacterium]|nr:hypothetical protein [Terriglobia bacterium]
MAAAAVPSLLVGQALAANTPSPSGTKRTRTPPVPKDGASGKKQRRTTVAPRVRAEGTCAVCCEPFNTTTHFLVVCSRCPFQACGACHKRYLLNSIATPHCMNCRYRWTHKTLLTLFRPSFVNTTFRRQRGQFLLDRAKSHLPLAMPFATTEKHLRDVDRRIKDLTAEARQIRRDMYAVHVPERRNRCSEITVLLSDLWAQHRELRRQSYQGRRKVARTTVAFEEPCPVNDCRGFIEKATQRCGICHVFVCRNCAHVLGHLTGTHRALTSDSSSSGSAAQPSSGPSSSVPSSSSGPPSSASLFSLTDEDKKELTELKHNHVCKPEDVESVKEIRQHSRLCPSCKSRIFRISGCDTMWCTQCNTGFNWRTGMVINDARDLHNPHYIEFIRNNPTFQYQPRGEERKTAGGATDPVP